MVFTDDNGRPMAGATRARPPRPADMPAVAPYQGPTGERLDPDAVFFTPTPPPPDAETDPGDVDAGDTDDSPPARRRRTRCRTQGRLPGDGPTTPRGPPPA